MHTHNIKWKQVALLGTIVLLTFFGSRNISQVPDGRSISEPRSSGFWEVSAIFIDDAGVSNWANAQSTYEWCSGSGSELDPYTIENGLFTDKQ